MIKYACTLISLVALAFAVGLAQGSNSSGSKSIDLRISSSSVEYRLLVVARKQGETIAWPGHAYFIVGKYDNEAGVCTFDTNDVIGYYPAENEKDIAAVFSYREPIPGEVRANLEKDLNQGLITHRFTIRLCDAGYEKLREAAKAYAKENKYSMGKTDCVDFMATVLTKLRDETVEAEDALLVPKKNEREEPAEYLSALFEANGIK